MANRWCGRVVQTWTRKEMLRVQILTETVTHTPSTMGARAIVSAWERQQSAPSLSSPSRPLSPLCLSEPDYKNSCVYEHVKDPTAYEGRQESSVKKSSNVKNELFFPPSFKPCFFLHCETFELTTSTLSVLLRWVLSPFALSCEGSMVGAIRGNVLLVFWLAKNIFQIWSPKPFAGLSRP